MGGDLHRQNAPVLFLLGEAGWRSVPLEDPIIPLEEQSFLVLEKHPNQN